MMLFMSKKVPLHKFDKVCVLKRCSSSSNSSVPPIHANPTFLKKLWLVYSKSLESNPLITKSITAGVLSLIADVASQTIFPTPIATATGHDIGDDGKCNQSTTDTAMTAYASKLDYQRIAKFSFLGVALVGPILHYWYGALVRFIPGTTMLCTMKRLFFDQLLFAPTFIAIFFSSALLLEGKVSEIPSKLESQWYSTVLANFAVWVPSQFVNFKFITPSYQVLFSNCVGVLWNIYLSYKTYNGSSSSSSSSSSSISKSDTIDIIEKKTN